MRKIIFTVMLACVAMVSVSAQSPFRIGVTAGLNYSSVSNSELDSKLGFKGGLRAEWYPSENLFLASGIQLSLLGASKKIDVAGVSHTSSMSPWYLNVPIHIGYKFSVGDGLSLLVSAGPYVSYGLFGKAKESLKAGEAVDGNVDVDIFGDEGGLERFDAGVGAKVGMEFADKYQVHIGYDLGLTDARKGDFEGAKALKNGNLFVSLAYMF